MVWWCRYKIYFTWYGGRGINYNLFGRYSGVGRNCISFGRYSGVGIKSPGVAVA